METVNLDTWEDLEDRIKDCQAQSDRPLFFRGQSNECWALDTTLERSEPNDILFAEYYRLISIMRPEIEAFTDRTWDGLPTYDDVLTSVEQYDLFSLKLSGFIGGLPGYNYIAHLRHHGFPSPLLDWTRTPYVAAYFAFRKPLAERVAIFAYAEYPQGKKNRSSGSPQIYSLGPYIKTHCRHYLQQSTYTMCLRWEQQSGWFFAPHASVFALNKSDEDLLWKFTLPAGERSKVLAILDRYNLNAFSLFASEEALLETLAVRHIDLEGRFRQQQPDRRLILSHRPINCIAPRCNPAG